MKHQGFVYNKPKGSDRNDCTVRALASATGAGYAVVREVLAAYGRKTNRGFDIETWLRHVGYKAFGKRFIPTPPTDFGHYLLWNGSHAWALVHGKLHDSWESGRRYRACFVVEPWDEVDPKLALVTKRAELLASI